MQRSFTVHGDEDYATACQAELVASHGVRRVAPSTDHWLTVGELLARFVAAPHHWSPATPASHAHVAGSLGRDRLARCRLDRLAPSVVVTAIDRWAAAGASPSWISGRFAVLHAALTWAIGHGLLWYDPLAGMRSPTRPYPRKHLPPTQVRTLITAAQAAVDKARAALAEQPHSRARTLRLWRAEQDLLLVRLVADSGLRRGELAALRTDDLDGRVLSIERAAKGTVVGPPKTHRRRRMTLGAITTRLWVDHVRAWRHHLMAGAHPGPWLFAADPRRRRIQPGGLSQRFHKLTRTVGIDAGMHRLRHTVGTVLVDHGQLGKACARLGHRDVATTLRHYYDAIPLDDQDVADYLDTLYDGDDDSDPNQ